MLYVLLIQLQLLSTCTCVLQCFFPFQKPDRPYLRLSSSLTRNPPDAAIDPESDSPPECRRSDPTAVKVPDLVSVQNARLTRLLTFSKAFRDKLHRMFHHHVHCDTADESAGMARVLVDGVVTRSALQNPDHSGWLYCLDSSEWKWCLLADLFLCIFSDPKEDKPEITILLTGYDVKPMLYNSAKRVLAATNAGGNEDYQNVTCSADILRNQFLVVDKRTGSKRRFAVESYMDLQNWLRRLRTASALDYSIFFDTGSYDEAASPRLRNISTDEMAPLGRLIACAEKSTDDSDDSKNTLPSSPSTVWSSDGIDACATSSSMSANAYKDMEYHAGDTNRLGSEIACTTDPRTADIGKLHRPNSYHETESKTGSNRVPVPNSNGHPPDTVAALKKKSLSMGRHSSMDRLKALFRIKSDRVQSSDGSSRRKSQESESDCESCQNDDRRKPKMFGGRNSRSRSRSRSRVKETLQDHSEKDSAGTHNLRIGSQLNEVILSGYLHHKHILKWNSVWCAISEGLFCVYHSATDGELPFHAVPLSECSLQFSHQLQGKRRFVFKLCQLGARSLYFSARTEGEFDSWLNSMTPLLKLPNSSDDSSYQEQDAVSLNGQDEIAPAESKRVASVLSLTPAIHGASQDAAREGKNSLSLRSPEGLSPRPKSGQLQPVSD